MKRSTRKDLDFSGAAGVLKALGHPLRVRLVCGLCREPSNLTRIVAALEAPISTVALHLGVLRRAGILDEERRGTEVLFRIRDERVPRILEIFCHAGQPPPSWDWDRLGESMRSEAVDSTVVPVLSPPRPANR